jgi:hypothetical protein
VVQANKRLLRRNSLGGSSQGSSQGDDNEIEVAASFPLVDAIGLMGGGVLEEALGKLTAMREDIDQLRMSTLQFLAGSPTTAKLEKMLRVLQSAETNSSGLRVKFCIPEEQLIGSILVSSVTFGQPTLFWL